MASRYPTPVDDVLGTIRELFHHQGNQVLTGFLDHCTGRIIDDDNDSGYSNDSSVYHILLLEAPPAIFAVHEAQIEKIESAVDDKLSIIRKGTGIHQLYRTRIVPQMRSHGRMAAPPPDKVAHLWQTGQIRLFISHLAADRKEIADLKENLAYFGVSGFVAHADIQPTREWEHEIMLALGSMQALVAIITPEFHQSVFTNQEIGVALGRGIQIISIKIDVKDPPGFLSSRQALMGRLNSPLPLARAIVKILLEHPDTAQPAREAILEHFVNSSGVVQTQECLKQIQKFPDFTREEAERLQTAFKNDWTTKAYYVPGKLTKLIQTHFPRFRDPTAEEPPVPDDDDIPF
jgi:hypothetical protein